jgi:hypothetical protein
MSDILIVLGEGAVWRNRDRLEKFFSEASFVIQCHVMGNVWAARTEQNPEQVKEHLSRVIQGEQFLIAPIPEGWFEINCTSRLKCFG